MQTTTQPGKCSPPPGTYRTGAMECPPFRFQVCLRLSWTSTLLLAVGITPTTTAGFPKGLPALSWNLWEASFLLRTPFTEGCDGVNDHTLPPGRSNMLYGMVCTFSTTSFSSVQPLAPQFSSCQRPQDRCALRNTHQRHTEFTERPVDLRGPFTEGCDGANCQTLPPGRSTMLYF